MSLASRALQGGARVMTDFSGRITEHEIVERIDGTYSTSGIGFYVRPNVPGGTGEWLDADWFEPAPMQQPDQGGGNAG